MQKRESIARHQSDQLLRAIVEHRDPETVLWFLRTLAATIALPSDPDLVSSKAASLYLELLDQINPTYAKYFAKQYSRACNRQRQKKSPLPSECAAHEGQSPSSSSAPASSNSAPGRYDNAMKKWVDPVKNQPPKESTLNTTGDFREFKELMRKIVNKKEKETKPTSSSPDPAAS